MVSKKSGAYLESAVVKLGPERAYDALRAFLNAAVSDDEWRGCALARAYGPVGLLAGHGLGYTGKAYIICAEIMGLTVREVIAVTRAFDGGWGDEYRELLKYLLVKEAGKLSAPRADSPELVTASAGRDAGEKA